MKFTFVSKRLWDRHLGKSSHYRWVNTHKRKNCALANELTERYYMVVKIDRENTPLDCMNTWEVRQTCCGQRVALLPCELGWLFYHTSQSQVDIEDFRSASIRKKQLIS